jgi:hypothetical protein
MTARSILTATLALAALGLVACGEERSGDGQTVTATKTVTEAAQDSSVSGDAILIQTRVTDVKNHKTEVLDESFIGESPFCPGGTATGGSDGPTITSTFHCPDGELTVQYAPTQRSLFQGNVWEIVSGTGSFEGLRGGGSMVAWFEGEPPAGGREIFAGTVSGTE